MLHSIHKEIAVWGRMLNSIIDADGVNCDKSSRIKAVKYEWKRI